MQVVESTADIPIQFLFFTLGFFQYRRYLFDNALTNEGRLQKVPFHNGLSGLQVQFRQYFDQPLAAPHGNAAVGFAHRFDAAIQ